MKLFPFSVLFVALILLGEQPSGAVQDEPRPILQTVNGSSQTVKTLRLKISQ